MASSKLFFVLFIVIFLFLVSGHFGKAAILFDSASTATTGSGIATNLSWPHTTSGTDRILVVGVSINTNTLVSSVSYGSVPLTKLTAFESGNAVRVSLWYLINPPLGQNSVTVNMSNSARFVAGAQSYAGVNQQIPIGVPVIAGGSGNLASVNVSSSANDLVVDVLARRGDLTTNPISPENNQVLLWGNRTVVNSGTNGVTGGGSSKVGSLSTNMSWNWPSSRRWALAAISLKPSQPPPDNTSPLRFNGLPSGILLAGTSDVVVSLNTDENADCRYSTAPNQTYLNMTNQFSGTGGTTHTENVTGLSGGVSYNFYVRCSDISDNRNGDDFVISFSVAQQPPPPPPPSDTDPPSIPQNLNAVAINFSEVDISWDMSTDNVGVIGYKVFRGDALISSVIANTFADTGLSELTNYIYEVLAFDAAGNESQKSASFEITTPAKPTETDDEPPSIPQNLVANSISTSEILLTWEPSTDNVGVVGYHIYRNSILISIETGIFFQDSGLDESTLYSYFINAFDYSGNESGNSQNVLATTKSIPPPADINPPIRFNGLPSGVQPSNTASALLSIETDENAECRYSLQPGVEFEFMSDWFVTTGGTHHEKFVTGLNAGTNYDYYIRCKDGSNNANSDDFNIMFSVAPLVDITPPSVPAGLTLSEISAAHIKFTWQGSLDNVGVDGYKIFRNGSLIASTKATEYSDIGLFPESTFNYSVSAFDAVGNESEQSAFLAITTLSEGSLPVIVSGSGGGSSVQSDVSLTESNTIGAGRILTGELATTTEGMEKEAESGADEENLVFLKSIFRFIRHMYFGLLGEDVKELQKLLAENKGIYPEGLITGYFGKYTRRAVQRFQCQFDIICRGDQLSTGYGRVGPKTINKLNQFLILEASEKEKFLFANRSLYFGMSSVEVKKLQEYLAGDPEVYPESLVTGYFGNLTRRAVQRFQCKNNIVCSGNEESTGYGRVGPETREKIQKSML